LSIDGAFKRSSISGSVAKIDRCEDGNPVRVMGSLTPMVSRLMPPGDCRKTKKFRSEIAKKNFYKMFYLLKSVIPVKEAVGK